MERKESKLKTPQAPESKQPAKSAESPRKGTGRAAHRNCLAPYGGFPRSGLWEWKNAGREATQVESQLVEQAETLRGSLNEVKSSSIREAYGAKIKLQKMDAFSEYDSRQKAKLSKSPGSLLKKKYNMLKLKSIRAEHRSLLRDASRTSKTSNSEKKLNKKNSVSFVTAVDLMSDSPVPNDSLSDELKPKRTVRRLLSRQMSSFSFDPNEESDMSLEIDAFFGEDAKAEFMKLFREESEEMKKHAPNRNGHAIRRDSADDPRVAYLQKCHEMSIVPEPLGIIRRNQSAAMSLQNYGIGDNRIQAISEGLKHMPKEIVSSINMANNRLTWRGVEALTKSLEKAECINEFDISHNYIGTRGAAALSVFISDFNSLTVLNLADTHIGDVGVENLCRGLSENSSITSLDLQSNEIGSAGGERLAELMTSSMKITQLNLSWNRIRGKGATAIAASLECSYVRVLDLSWNAFGSSEHHEAATEFHKALARNRTLQCLKLTHNNLKGNDISYLLQGMSESSSLLCLHLDSNINASVVLTEDAKHIVSSIRRDGADPTWTFTRSWMEDNKKPHVVSSIATTRGISLDDSSSISSPPTAPNGDTWSNSMKKTSASSTRKCSSGSAPICISPWLEVKHCYICERWRKVKLVYTPLLSGPAGKRAKVLIWSNLIDDSCHNMVWDDSVVRDKIVFSKQIYLPLEEVRYSFQIDGLSVWAADQEFTINLAKESLRRNLGKALNNKFGDMDFEQYPGPKDLSRINIIHAVRVGKDGHEAVSASSCLSKRTSNLTKQPSVFENCSDVIKKTLHRKFPSDFEASNIAKLPFIHGQTQLDGLRRVISNHYKLLHDIYLYASSFYSPGFRFTEDVWMESLANIRCLKKLFLEKGPGLGKQIFESLWNSNERCNEASAALSLSGLLNAIVQLAFADIEVRSGRVQYTAEELDSFIVQTLVPFAIRDSAISVRRLLLSDETMAVYRIFLPGLQETFQHYAILETEKDKSKAKDETSTNRVQGSDARSYFVYTIFVKLLREAELDSLLTRSESRLVFGSSLGDTCHSLHAESRMYFNAFLESIGRIGLLISDRFSHEALSRVRSQQGNTPPPKSKAAGPSTSSNAGPGLSGKKHPGPWREYGSAIQLEMNVRMLPLFNILAQLRNHAVQLDADFISDRLTEWRDDVTRITTTLAKKTAT